MNESNEAQDHSWLKSASTKSEEVAVNYDDWAEKYDADLEEWEYQAPAEAARLLKTYVPETGKILDAGCGTGLTGSALKNAGYIDITGIDISAKSLPIAEKTGAYSRVSQQDLQKQPFPFEPGEFDAINCVGVLTYIEDPKSLFEEFCRIVRPGGHIVFTHREDLIEPYGYPETLKALEEKGCWKKLLTSEPKPYLPQNEDFADHIKVVYFIYQTTDR